MAASLDIILLTTNHFSIHKIVNYMNEFYDLEIQIAKITLIDNWLWEGERELSPGDTIDSCLLNGKIVIVGLKSSLFKDLGIFLEKVDKKYIYTFWINTEAYPELDTDLWNIDIYLKIFSEIQQITKEFGYLVDAVAVGIETNFVYQKDMMEMIKKSENINAWSFDKPITTDDLLGFIHRKIGDNDIYISTGNQDLEACNHMENDIK